MWGFLRISIMIFFITVELKAAGVTEVVLTKSNTILAGVDVCISKFKYTRIHLLLLKAVTDLRDLLMPAHIVTLTHQHTNTLKSIDPVI